MKKFKTTLSHFKTLAKTLGKKLGKKGQGSIAVLMLASLVAAASLVISGLITRGTSTQKNVLRSELWSEIGRLAVLSVNNRTACLASLNGLPANPTLVRVSTNGPEVLLANNGLFPEPNDPSVLPLLQVHVALTDALGAPLTTIAAGATVNAQLRISAIKVRGTKASFQEDASAVGSSQFSSRIIPFTLSNTSAVADNTPEDCVGSFNLQDMCVSDLGGVWNPGGSPQCELPWNNVAVGGIGAVTVPRNTAANTITPVSAGRSTAGGVDAFTIIGNGVTGAPNNAVMKMDGLMLRPNPSAGAVGEIWISP